MRIGLDVSDEKRIPLISAARAANNHGGSVFTRVSSAAHLRDLPGFSSRQGTNGRGERSVTPLDDPEI